MGNALPRAQVSQQDLRTCLLEYTPKQGNANLVAQEIIGGGKFLKAMKARSEVGYVVVKVRGMLRSRSVQLSPPFHLP
jgi:hypothetical protein